MKKKFSKILGIGLTLALLTSLLLTAAPVLADVSQPTVDVDGDEISATGEYTMSFRINTELIAASDTITVRFPEDTDVSGAVVGIAGVSYTSGIGYGAGDNNAAITVNAIKDDRTVEIPLTGIDTAGIGDMAYVQVVIGGITNPTDTGTFTLEVKTSAETDYVESEEYEIGVPTVGGFVYVYNPSNILLATYGGKAALNSASDYYDDADFTIKVGPGTYDLTGTITISGAGLTLESSEGAEDTIIDVSGADRPAIHITNDDVIVDGFTLDGSLEDVIWIKQGTDGVTIQNNIFSDGDWSAIVLEGENDNVNVVTGATISDNVFEDNYTAITLLGGATDCTISDNTITGSTDTVTAITFGGGSATLPTQGNTITGNAITLNDGTGIWLFDGGSGAYFDDNEISGNTISENAGDGIFIAASLEISELQILDNYIADNEDDGIELVSWDDASGDISNVIKFNTITGNDDGINNDSAYDVDATFNWWGTDVAADIADMVNDTDNGVTTYDPFLTDVAEAVIVDGKSAGNVSSLDAKTECGVKVSGMESDTSSLVADVISALEYAANPEEAIDDAIGFYDVYALLDAIDAGGELDEVEGTLKFYNTAITSGSTVKWWTGDFWDDCSDQDARAGLVWVTVTEDTAPALEELEGTAFVVVGGEAVEDVFGAPVIATPTSGDDTVSLTPLFAWGAVPDAVGYDFQFADNANFVAPLVHLVGENRLIVTAYAYVQELPYSTAYYWRVKAVSATAESEWSSAVFITKDEPVEPTPPVVIEETEPPVIIIEQPDIIVPLPAETPITPSWIYVIIGVGAVLVIALLVLIVRTRRVA